jgi:hypothetical protein
MNAHRRNVGVAAGTLLATGATLVCCVLPAFMVAIGAGAALASLVSAVPQLVWLSQHKNAVFLVAAALLLAAGILIARARSAPCPADPEAARICRRLRRTSALLYFVALGSFGLGATFAFLLPALST